MAKRSFDRPIIIVREKVGINNVCWISEKREPINQLKLVDLDATKSLVL